MTKRYGQFIGGAAALTIAALTLVAPAKAQEYTMKFATLTINDSQHEFIKMYKTELERATNGRIKVEIYPAGQLGNAQRQTEGLRLGTIEGVNGPSELFVGADQRFQAPAMAGLFRDADHARNFLDCVKSRKPANCPVAVGHRSTSATLLAKIALRRGRSLTWDAQNDVSMSPSRETGAPARAQIVPM